jgi:hypothetical protein
MMPIGRQMDAFSCGPILMVSCSPPRAVYHHLCQVVILFIVLYQGEVPPFQENTVATICEVKTVAIYATTHHTCIQNQLGVRLVLDWSMVGVPFLVRLKIQRVDHDLTPHVRIIRPKNSSELSTLSLQAQRSLQAC